MSVAKIRLFPDPLLRKNIPRQDIFNAALAKHFRLMEKIMSTQPLGIGIAAPQIGIPRRLAIVDVSARTPGTKRLYLVNPEVLEQNDEVLSREGCMSLPEYTADLKRFNWIRLQWQDLQGNFHEKIATGIEAICIQHEVDHLNGILFFDRVAALKTDMIPRKLSARKK